MQPFFWASGVQRPRCGEKGTWQKVDVQKGGENSKLNVVDLNVGSDMIRYSMSSLQVVNSQLMPIAWKLACLLFLSSRPLTFIPLRNRVGKRTDI